MTMKRKLCRCLVFLLSIVHDTVLSLFLFYFLHDVHQLIDEKQINEPNCLRLQGI
jgi:hypothetical protein